MDHHFPSVLFCSPSSFRVARCFSPTRPNREWRRWSERVELREMAGGEAPRPPLLCRHSLTLRLFLLFLTICSPFSTAVNITAVLSAYTDLAYFNNLLVSTSIPVELSGRSSLTILAVPNAFLLRSAAVRTAAAADIADVLRYHVLLEYLSWSELSRISSGGKLVTTLYQTTGRAAGNLGAVNLTRSDGIGGAVIARCPSSFSSSNATVLALVGTLPYNVSIFAVNALLLPSGFDLAASETRPPVGVNITHVLVDGHDFNVAASMLEASGVAEEFEADEHGAGITVFVPTDEAFADLPATERLQSLPADRKAVVLRFHVLHSYYPLGSLESIVNPVQPTLATENTGAGRFTLNITRVNGSVAIDTGMVQASITRTVFDQNPVAIFAVSKVLLPREIFAREAAGASQLHSAATPPLDSVGLPPQGADAVDSPPARLSSPPGAKEVVAAGAVAFCRGVLQALCSTASLYLMLLLIVLTWMENSKLALLRSLIPFSEGKETHTQRRYKDLTERDQLYSLRKGKHSLSAITHGGGGRMIAAERFRFLRAAVVS